MKRIAMVAVAVGLLAWTATSARADDQMTARDIQAAVDSYIASANQDANLVGGPGSAGYDSGFWIRGGDFSLRINLTLQARYEYFNFDKAEDPTPGGDLSGFSLPRATLKLSGTAPCSMRYYTELEFGHQVTPLPNVLTAGVPANQVPAALPARPAVTPFVARNTFPWAFQTQNFALLREAWIEWGYSDALNFRMGLIKTPNTRQLMVPPELQQFIDISMASSVTGVLQPGYTDRNRDYGFMLHGALGANGEFGWMFAVTNGDGGDGIRNVTNGLTSDNLAFSGRLNWAFLNAIGYTEGATRQNTCTWYGEIGAWGHYYADRLDKPHIAIWDRLAAGVDLALGYGGFSFTGAFTIVSLDSSTPVAQGGLGLLPEDWTIFLVQAGYHFPDTAWEIAARFSHYERDIGGAGAVANTPNDPNTNEIGVAINYYLNGHSNKLQLDAAFIQPDSMPKLGGYYDAVAGVPLGFNSGKDAMLIRFQWQLAL